MPGTEMKNDMLPDMVDVLYPCCFLYNFVFDELSRYLCYNNCISWFISVHRFTSADEGFH